MAGRTDEHEAPDEGCRCGLHARTTLDGITAEYPYYPIHGYWAYQSSPTSGMMAMGAVLLWGRILRGDKVIRAEFGRVLCLTDPADPWVTKVGTNNPAAVTPERREQRLRTIGTVCADYGVPFVPYDTVTRYAAEFGEAA